MALNVLRRVPVMLQQSPTECGAASLAMLMSALGRPTTVDECTLLMGGGRDGASARSVLTAARSLGASAQAVVCRDPGLPGVELPVIAHWEFNHFVVVEKVGATGVTVVDPAKGRRRLTPEAFSDGFTGVIIAADRDPSWGGRPSSPRSRSIHAALGLARRADGAGALLGQLLLAALVLQVLALAPAAASMLLLNQVLPLGLDSLVVTGLLLTGVLLVGRAALGVARSLMVIALETRVDMAVLHGTFRHVLSLPYTFFERRSTGDTVMRLMSTAVIRQAFGTQALGAILDGITSVGYLVALAIIDTRLALVAAAIGFVQSVLLLAAGAVLRGRVAEELAEQARTQSLLVELVSSIASVKASGAERVAVDRFLDAHTRQLHASVRRAHLGGVADACSSGLHVAAPIVLLLVGAQLVFEGDLSVGAMVAAGLVGGFLVSSLASTATAALQLQMASGLVERLADLLRQEPEQLVSCTDDPGRSRLVEVSDIRGDVRIEGLTVRYAPSNPPAVEAVDLDLPAGTTTALVGPSGAGKTTVAKAVLGLARPDGGRVLIDGRDLWEHELTSVRRHFGVVLQDAVLFDGTIAENIAFDVPNASSEELRAAARAAHLLEEIDAMPMGFETRIAEAGAALSGGQRQRMVLARALLRRPRVLVLDEATSQLDARTEAAVADALDALGCTRLVIAHRLSTVRRADRIVVMDHGEVVEQGTHAELQAIGGVYAELVRTQLAM